MPVSKPMQMFAVRLTEEERSQLERIAAERNVTLSYAIREGIKAYARELAERGGVGGRVAAS